jgi:hypothetical protein
LQALHLKAYSVIKKNPYACHGIIPKLPRVESRRELRKHFKKYFRQMKIKKPENAETAQKKPPFRAGKTPAAFHAQAFSITAQKWKTKKNRRFSPAVLGSDYPMLPSDQWLSSSIKAA